MDHPVHMDIDSKCKSYDPLLPSGLSPTPPQRQDTRASLNSTEERTTICPLTSSLWGYDDKEGQRQRREGEDIGYSFEPSGHSLSSPLFNTLLFDSVTTGDSAQALNPNQPTATSELSRYPKRPPSALSIGSLSRRPTPYRIPPPLSSCRSTIMDEEEDKKPTREELDEPMDPSTPIRAHYHRRINSAASDTVDPLATPRSSGGTSVTSSPALPSPSGSMSLRDRSKKSAPTFPASPRQDLSQPVSASHLQSHRQQIARSALISPAPRSAVPASAPLRTPALLRVIASPTTPAFYKTGYNHPFRAKGSSSPVYYMRTPQSPYFHRGGMAPKTPMSASAPARTPVRPVPPAKAGGILPEKAELDKVSKAWVVKSLQQNAPNVWYSPETTDCRVVVPVWSKIAARKKAREEAAKAQAKQAVEVKQESDDSAIEVDSPTSGAPETPLKAIDSTTPGTADSVHSNQPGKTYWPPTPEHIAQVNAAAKGMAKGKEDVVSSRTVKRGRRGSLPEGDTIPVIVFPLHTDYLITQSKLFRRLFSSTSSQLDLPIPSVADAPGTSRSVSEGGTSQEPHSGVDSKLKGSKVLPTPRGEPEAVYIPMPDPAAFGVIVQWLYWGDPKAVEMALSQGIINWEGLVYNIDYLDLEDDIKRIVGKWWRKWVKTESSAGSRKSGTAYDEDDDEEEERQGGGSGMEADEEDELQDDTSDLGVKQEPMDDLFVDGFRRL